MTSLICRSGAVAAIAVITTIGSASVARADETIVAKVPFTFIVGDTRLPAGDYVVTELADGSGVVDVKSADGRQFAMTLTIPTGIDNAPSEPQLVFQKFENQYFLARIAPSDGSEREVVLTPSIMEHDVVRSTAHASN
jgi:hypothetical protein